MMRYSSKRQEFFAEKGRVTVLKRIYPSEFVEYVVMAPDKMMIKSSKSDALNLAKVVAVLNDLAFNPLFDYEETSVRR